MKKLVIIIPVFYFVFSFLKAQTINWWYDVHDKSFGQSAAEDIDGDGKLEIVFGCYRNDSSVYALNAGDGSLLWKYNTHVPGAEGCNDVAPVIFDVDGDGKPEVIVPSSCNPKTYCFDGATGAVKWVCNTRGSDSPPTVADIDGDGDLEILHGEFGGYVICINAKDGKPEWEIPVDLNSWIQTAPTITDLDGDGQPDFVVATWNSVNRDSNAVYAFRGHDRSLLWKYRLTDVVYHGSAVADLDDDGFPELVIGCYNDTLYCINGDNGTTNWKYTSGNGFYMGAPASIADLDGDGKCEVVFSSYYKVGVLSATGTLRWDYPVPGYGQSFRGTALADINSDSYLDIIFGTSNGKVIALNGSNGSVIWIKDLAAHYGNSKFSIDHAPLIADFNNDDSLDVFIVGGYTEYPNFQVNFGRAYMITAGKGKGPDWLMFQNNLYRQSSLCAITPQAVDKGGSQPLDALMVFPNPSKSSITIQFSNPKRIPHSLTIFDILGQAIYRTENITGSEIRLENVSWKKSLYFFRLENKSQVVGKGKFVIE